MDPIAPISLSLPVLDGLGPSSSSADPGSSAAPLGTAVAGANFTGMLADAIGALSGLQQNADAAVAGVASGQGTDIHQAMIAMDQASLGMSLATQVRDKAVEAYQSLMNMQV